MLLFAGIIFYSVEAQDALKYQVPAKEITAIVDAKPTPVISVSPDKMNIVLIDRPGIPSISDLAAEELRLAGLRIDPVVNGPSRQTFNTSFKLINIDGTNQRTLTGMPSEPRLGSPEWSFDGKYFAFTNTTKSSTELWVCDVATLDVKKIDDNLNAIFGNTITWLPDNKSLVYLKSDDKRGKVPARSQVPEGPVVQENLGGKGQAATYQDLLKDPVDESLFEYYGKSKVTIWNGAVSTSYGTGSVITDFSVSPDGNYILVTTIKKPFSYIVPYNNFPSVIAITDLNGKIVKTLLETPLRENLPRGYDMVIAGPRQFGWRTDVPATVYWVEALDGGDYSVSMEHHDQVYTLSAPFTGEALKFIATEKRFAGVNWGNASFALITEGLSKTRIRVTSSFNPADPQNSKKKIFEINQDDSYNNPGRFATAPNQWGRNTLLFGDKGKSLYLTGTGSSPEGDRPFVDKYDIATGKITRLFRSEAPYYEAVTEILDISKNLILTSRQSVNEVPNYYIRDVKKGTIKQVTKFENPYPQLEGIHKELVRYKRNDGVDLSFTLYLPKGYDKTRDGRLPTLLWAYPREFNDPSTAGQVTGSPFMFTRIAPASALVYLTQGYAVLMDATFPIVGVEGKEPNDTFIEQLKGNAEAAVNKAVEMGVTDPARVAVSGHSYGAFMTANLLAHTRLFAAGIAESGAYNRTLTPFGFQNERRNYWDAPDLYNTMSPFMHADDVKDPLLLIHGIADNNSGTFPIQSERYYAALKGFGAISRLVMLPLESHGYAARETILHKHWEVLTWMDKYVKNKK